MLVGYIYAPALLEYSLKDLKLIIIAIMAIKSIVTFVVLRVLHIMSMTMHGYVQNVQKVIQFRVMYIGGDK